MIRALIGKFYVWSIDMFSNGQYQVETYYECAECGEAFEEEEAALHTCYEIAFIREGEEDAA